MTKETLQLLQTAVLSPDGVLILAMEIERLRAENERLRIEHEALIDEVMGDATRKIG